MQIETFSHKCAIVAAYVVVLPFVILGMYYALPYLGMMLLYLIVSIFR